MYRVFRVVLLNLVFIVFVLGCDRFKRVDYVKENKAKTYRLMSEAVKQVGLPNIHNFWQRKQLKMILEIADDSSVLTYAYTFDRDSGLFRYLGRAVGFGVPFSAQYTSPMQLRECPRTMDCQPVPQPDPNGLYMPSSSSATWLILIDIDGNFNLVYMEPSLTVSQIPLPERIVEGGYPPGFWKDNKTHISHEELEKGLKELKQRRSK